MPCQPIKRYDALAFQKAKRPTCNLSESGARLVIEGEDVACYRLDGNYFRPEDCLCEQSNGSGRKRCDALITGCVGDTCYVIFVDLKKSKVSDPQQLLDTICYFCRCETEGERHHTLWSDHERAKFRNHKVIALFVNEKPPKNLTKSRCGKLIHWRSANRKQKWSSLQALLEAIGPV